jgi:hypothetical protein
MDLPSVSGSDRSRSSVGSFFFFFTHTIRALLANLCISLEAKCLDDIDSRGAGGW